MKFKLKSARYHPLQGLELVDQNGMAFMADTKWSLLVAGVVSLRMTEPGECPYRVTYNLKGQQFMPDEERTINGTDDPVALAMARKYHDEFPEPFSRDWQDVPLD